MQQVNNEVDMTLNEISAALADRRLSVVALATGLSRQTLARIRDGLAVSPAHTTVETLREYFGDKE